MNPLQKKCVLVTAGFHLLLVVILFLGPAFFSQPKPKTDSLPVLKTVPLGAIEAALTAGTVATTPPSANQPPAQPIQQPVTPTPLPPEPPKPVVTPPVEPTPVEPTPTPVKPDVEKPVEPKPDYVKPAEPAEPDVPKPDEQPDPIPKPKPKPHKVVPVLDQFETPTPPLKHPHRDTSKADQAEADARAEEKAARDAAHRRAIALRKYAASLGEGLSSSTDIKVVGTSSVATANYGQIVKSIYYNAWVLPSSAANDESSPVVRVVIARDGSVISAHIIEPSGDAAVDDSVQRALDSVSSIQPFADSATERQRTYTIKFDLKTKRML